MIFWFWVKFLLRKIQINLEFLFVQGNLGKVSNTCNFTVVEGIFKFKCSTKYLLCKKFNNLFPGNLKREINWTFDLLTY